MARSETMIWEYLAKTSDHGHAHTSAVNIPRVAKENRKGQVLAYNWTRCMLKAHNQQVSSFRHARCRASSELLFKMLLKRDHWRTRMQNTTKCSMIWRRTLTNTYKWSRRSQGSTRHNGGRGTNKNVRRGHPKIIASRTATHVIAHFTWRKPPKCAGAAASNNGVSKADEQCMPWLIASPNRTVHASLDAEWIIMALGILQHDLQVTRAWGAHLVARNGLYT